MQSLFGRVKQGCNNKIAVLSYSSLLEKASCPKSPLHHIVVVVHPGQLAREISLLRLSLPSLSLSLSPSPLSLPSLSPLSLSLLENGEIGELLYGFRSKSSL